jgi:protocatechuate 3,4-dioxygenase beta subunit
MTPSLSSPGERDDHDRGFGADLPRLLALGTGPAVMGRRRMLALLGGAGALGLLAACGSRGSGSAATTTSSAATSTSTTAGTVGTAAATAAGAGTEIPDETAGPYPADGTNGPNVLTESGVVRSDIRSSFGSSSTVAEGVPLRIDLTVVEAASGDPVPGAAVYLWHCDRDGGYSLYSRGIEEENYLRGVQVAGDGGALSFTSIFPACYSGRWPHAHFEVYEDLASATSGADALTTSQLALPREVCEVVYATSGYEQSVPNLGQVSLDSDMVFRDGVEEQMATVTGDPDSGYVAALVVRI